MLTEREQQLADALEAALRWPYQRDMLDHIRNGAPTEPPWARAYIDDIHTIRRAMKIINTAKKTDEQ